MLRTVGDDPTRTLHNPGPTAATDGLAVLSIVSGATARQVPIPSEGLVIGRAEGVDLQLDAEVVVQREPARGALQQARSKLVLEPGDRLRDCRDRYAELRRGGGKAAALGHPDERLHRHQLVHPDDVNQR